MGYLVYCPTCKTKISDSAKSCPACGEWRFFEFKRLMSKCTSCNGTGRTDVNEYQYSMIIAYQDNRIYFPQYFIDSGNEYWDQSWHNGEGGMIPIGEWVEVPGAAEAKRAIAKGDYKITDNYIPTKYQDEQWVEGKKVSSRTACGFNARLSYNKKPAIFCPSCKGNGQVGKGESVKIDLRTRVGSQTYLTDEKIPCVYIDPEPFK